MKVGDLVIINVPIDMTGNTKSCNGMIIDRKVLRENDGVSVKNRTWFYVLRSDTGTIQKFHEDWMEAGENGSW